MSTTTAALIDTFLDTASFVFRCYPQAGALLLAAVKTTAILALAFSLASLLQQRSAAARVAVWRLAFAALLGLGLWQAWPQQTQPVGFQIELTPAVIEAEPLPLAAPLPLPLAESHPLLEGLEAYGLAAWLGMAAALLLYRVLIATAGRWWLHRHSRPAPSVIEGLCQALCRDLSPARRPSCRLTERTGSPLLTGFWTAIIWLPAEAATWQENRLRAVLLHELAHHRRQDIAWLWLMRAAQCLWWWQPLAWLAGTRLSQMAEHAADDHAILSSGETPSYARALVEIAAGIPEPMATGVGVPMFGRGAVQDRVLALLKTNRWRGKIGSGVMLLLGLVGLIALAFTVLNVRYLAQPSQYVSMAKLVAGGKMASSSSGPQYEEYLKDFCGTIIETLESREMGRRAEDRCRALHPDLKLVPVTVQVVQGKGSAVFITTATGSEPKYLRAYLDALLDEFRAFRQSIHEQQRNKALTAVAEDLVKSEHQLADAQRLTQAPADARASHQTMLDLKRKPMVSEDTNAVAIMERATTPAVAPGPWWVLKL